MSLDERIEEALETLWVQLEEGIDTPDDLPPEVLSDLSRAGLVVGAGPSLAFTDGGRTEARGVIRRHRLAEALFHDVVDASHDDMEAAACQTEHALRKEVEERVCALLGHPETCPHGQPIPPGPCCVKARAAIERNLAPLSHLKRGEWGTVAYLKTRDSRMLQKLMAMGVRPGSEVRIDQSFPSHVFTVGFSQYAVDTEMAALILVRRGVEGPPEVFSDDSSGSPRRRRRFGWGQGKGRRGREGGGGRM